MKTKLGKLLSLLACTAALAILVCSTAAQGSFVSQLPAGYVTYGGQLNMGKSCSCATGGISGAPAGPPPCNSTPCVGSSNTRYGWFVTTASEVNSTVCKIGPPCFQLDGDDAVVISGSMSSISTVTYYSFTLYQTYIYSPRALRQYVQTRSSVGFNLNKANLKRGSDGRYVVIVTASTKTLSVVKNSLSATGIPDQIINSYLVPASVANLGSVSYPDQLSLSFRITAQSEIEKYQVETFVNQAAPATEVSFIKGPGLNGDVTFDSSPNWEDTLRVNEVEYKTGLDQKLAELEQSVTNVYARRGYKLKARLTEELYRVDSAQCRTNVENCNFDSPDALYTAYPCDFSPFPLSQLNNCNFQLGANSDDILMLLGVNHSLVGGKTLASYISQESRTTPGTGSQDGTFTYVGLYTQGSANQYLRQKKAAALYAVKIARNCGSDLYCAAVPYLGGTPEQTGFYLTGRIYLDKVAKSAPNP
ncbi:MAG TPA: hypothetical protein V6D48_04830, partial [Oculatellaceae cyanobacterium]